MTPTPLSKPRSILVEAIDHLNRFRGESAFHYELHELPISFGEEKGMELSIFRVYKTGVRRIIYTYFVTVRPDEKDSDRNMLQGYENLLQDVVRSGLQMMPSR
jgi:hypothetical protein